MIEQPKEKIVCRDPITLLPIEGDIDKLTILNGTLYNAISLIKYLSCSQNFKDPITNDPLSEEQVVALNKLSIKLLGSSKIWELYSEGEKDKAARRIIKNEILSYESILGEILSEMIELVELPFESLEDKAELEIELSIKCSDMEVPFEALKKLDLEAAYFFQKSAREYLKVRLISLTTKFMFINV